MAHAIPILIIGRCENVFQHVEKGRCVVKDWAEAKAVLIELKEKFFL